MMKCRDSKMADKKHGHLIMLITELKAKVRNTETPPIEREKARSKLARLKDHLDNGDQ